jgi:DNA-binding response OmpR family regulator
MTRPHVVLLGAEWRARALLRAQLIEEGYEVAAFDVWSAAKRYLQSGFDPRIAIVDLRTLPDPRRVLAELGALITPDRVLVVTALGTLSSDEIRRQGFCAIARPVSVAEVLAAASRLLRSTRQNPQEVHGPSWAGTARPHR